MIRQAAKKDIPELKRLWEEAFGREDDFENDFFAHVFREAYAFCLEKEGVLAAMLYMLPCTLSKHGEKPRKAVYFYGLATHKHFRRQGLMAELISYAMEKAGQEGCECFFLISAEEHLIPYYEKFGFRKSEAARAGNMAVEPVGYVGKEKELYRLSFPAPVEEFCRRQALLSPTKENALPVCCIGEPGPFYGAVPM